MSRVENPTQRRVTYPAWRLAALAALCSACQAAANPSGQVTAGSVSPAASSSARTDVSASGTSSPAAASGMTVARPEPTASLPLPTARSTAGTASAGNAGNVAMPPARDEDAGAMGSTPIDMRCHADLNRPQRTDYALPGPYAVASVDITFEDTTRPIAQTAGHAAASSRTLLTTVYYPSASAAAGQTKPALAQGGPFPMLMYSHGYSSGRWEAEPIAKRAVTYGYIVVVPEFPLTNIMSNNGKPDVNDAANQPGDVSFLIDKLLALSADSAHVLAGAVDEKRIGTLGVSLGGLTALLLTFHPRFHDERIKVSMPIAPKSSFFEPGFYHTREIPLLLMQGDLDAFIDYETNGRRSFERAAPNARLITLAKGTHAAFGAAFDLDSLPVLIGLIGAAGADPSNPDGVGCGAVADALSMTGPEFVNALGGPADFIATQEPGQWPCHGDEYKHPALDPKQQEDIAVRSATAFFEAHLGKTEDIRQDACRYLLVEIPKHPAVKLE